MACRVKPIFMRRTRRARPTCKHRDGAQGMNVAGTELMTLRAARRRRLLPAPFLDEARAAAPMVAQVRANQH